MSESIWISRPLEYKVTKLGITEEIMDHPLKTIDGKYGSKVGTLKNTMTGPSTITSIYKPMKFGTCTDDMSIKNSTLDGTDPLTQFAQEELDSLSQMAASEWENSSNSLAKKKVMNTKEELIEPWSIRRETILNKYTTSEKLSIVTSFLIGGEKIVKIQSNNMVNRVRTRLEQLDDFEDGTVRQMRNLSQQEYVLRIEQLSKELVQAWYSDQRVKALKIAIQCAKLVVDTAAIAFYPSKFVLVTDILDIFGKLVYERLKLKADYHKSESKLSTSLSDNFNPDMIPENAKETCRNWFYKTASIRELVPRLYIEMAIIKSYSFLTLNEFNKALFRITRMIRGVGDPLVAIYARYYLCRVGLALKETSNYEFVRENLYDFFLTYHQLFDQSIKRELDRQNILPDVYLNLYMPALDWILQVISRTASTENVLMDVLSRCKHQNNRALLFNAIFEAFKPSYISGRAIEFIEFITECRDDSGFPQYLLYCSLGQCLIKKTPPKDDCQAIYNNIWEYISSLDDTTKFMNCIEIWIQFIVVNYSIKELNDFLGQIINHIGATRSREHYYVQLQAIINKIVLNIQDLESIFTMENFLPLIDLFHKENIKVEVCKSIIGSYSVYKRPISDSIIINALMFICRIMHDSVTALTVADEKRQIGALISNLIQQVDYGRDFEKQLNFYAETRAIFPNIDSIHIQLVQCVNQQAVSTRKIVSGHHTRRTAAFVRACAAFCYITIPSLTVVQTRLQLYLLSGQVALLNQCLGQADACFKAALSLVPEMPKTIEMDGRLKNSEPYLLSYLSNFLSTLLIVPDSPEHGVLYLLRGLLNVIQRYFDEYSSVKCSLYLRVLDLLSVTTHDSYPYHVDKIDSNDKLYGGDDKFIREVNKISTKILEEILDYLKYLNATSQYDQQSYFSIELFGRLIIRSNVRQLFLANMVVSLWNSSHRLDCTDPKMRIRALEYVTRKSQRQQFAHLTEILIKLLM
ncbi:hypothetical protein PV326_010778 [Microctonus aethiopoides]|uniref:VPS35 endosomal protein sorting factor-like n=1 Tax=Microctonus aethiopoides TaxID=144406 RepID=A0AA39EZ22_9HYME|nr:hypothetical protein PV326_010778 [Microctonus aethiopoides]KAK0160322.1 hypothetical protein PV328_007748 [Microctonus aethiopoides]